MVWGARPLLLTLLCVVVSSLWASSALAGIKTEVSARRVGVGQAIVVQLTVTQEEDQAAPSDPQLRVSGGAVVQGPSVSTQSMVRMHNFSFSSEKSVIARWQVIPQKEGQLTIGPGSFQVGGRRISGETIVVEVVKDAAPTPGRGRRRVDPFDMFGADPFGNDPSGNDPFDDFFGRRARRAQLPEAPKDYQLEHAPDEIAFLTAQLSRSKVVVGEPVMVTVMGYGSQGDFVEIAPTEPALPDMLTFRAMDNLQSEPAYQLEVDGRVYIVRKLRQYIVVPLRAGEMKVGALTTVLQNNRRSYPARGHGQGYAVRSPELTLRVHEPPKAERPAGYTLGDVGRYRLAADISQRKVIQGEFIEVVVRVSGEGAIPSRVIVPEQNGVVWEAPSAQGGPEVQDGILQGTRTLKYTVQLTAVGTMDLGAITLPYFDDKSRRYEIARLELGQVDVAPAAGAPASGASNSPKGVAPTPADGVDAATAAPLGAPLEPRNRALDVPLASQQPAPWAWKWLFAGPLGLFLGTGLARGTRRALRARKADVRVDPQATLRAAEGELKAGNAERALLVAERALFEAIERSTGVKARGVMRSDVARVLRSHGCGADQATEIQRCLEDLEASRYGSSSHEPSALLEQVRSAIKDLPRPRKGRGS